MEAKIDQNRKNIDPELWHKVKMIALSEKTTIANIIERALKNEVKRLEAQNGK